jgi:hypothetical protein
MWFVRQIMHIKTSLKIKKRRIEDNNIKKIEKENRMIILPSRHIKNYYS